MTPLGKGTFYLLIAWGLDMMAGAWATIIRSWSEAVNWWRIKIDGDSIPGNHESSHTNSELLYFILFFLKKIIFWFFFPHTKSQLENKSSCEKSTFKTNIKSLFSFILCIFFFLESIQHKAKLINTSPTTNFARNIFLFKILYPLRKKKFLQSDNWPPDFSLEHFPSNFSSHIQ